MHTARQFVNEDGYAGAATLDRVSPFDELARAIGHLEKAAAFANEVADKLTGPVNEACAGEGILTPDNGLMGRLQRYANDVNSLSVKVIDHLTRIQDRL